MKRLVKKSESINEFDHIKVTPDIQNMDNMIELDELSEADVRHERCPACKYNPLKREDGFKICPRCETQYKVLDGTGYMITE